MTKTWTEIDDQALDVDEALRQVGQRIRALEQLGKMADEGQFDEFLKDKKSYAPAGGASAR